MSMSPHIYLPQCSIWRGGRWSQRIAFRCSLVAGRFTAVCCGVIAATVAGGWTSTACAAQRPNILWISCEDISPNLGCYGDPHATTPNLDRLASQGVRFTRAFTPAGVCAVVRNSVITGMYAPSIGGQHMRSRIIPPPEVKAFPEYLRAAGYFTTNRSKTDYQFEATPSIWNRQGKDHTDWRERPDPDQPFFSVVNITVTHESQIRHSEARHREVIEEIGEENRHEPSKVAETMPAYLPKTSAALENWAWYYDNITLMDRQVGELLRRLEEDGLAENTLVVFWSDHGMGMPRGKRWIYDTGVLVPMIVRWPGQLEEGEVRRDLVSMIDLAPTMLRVAGVDVPRHMQGRALFGAGDRELAEEPAYLFFHRDRMDEAYELQRAARDRRWKYIRNYEPDRTYAQHIDYMDKMPAMRDWRRLAAEGQLEGGQRNWFAESKPIEELYDTEKDPWELENLASLPQYADRLGRMRRATESWQQRIGDTGLVPEPVLMEEMKPGGTTPRTEAPEIVFNGREAALRCETEGASIIYRLGGDGGWGEWRLYVKSVDVGERPLEALACRLGYRDSKTVRSNATQQD